MPQLIKSIFVEASRETKSRLLGKDKVEDTVDGAYLASGIEQACNDLAASGYTVLQIVPVTSGGNNYKNGVGYGYGYGYTSGVIIVAAKN